MATDSRDLRAPPSLTWLYRKMREYRLS